MVTMLCSLEDIFVSDLQLTGEKLCKCLKCDIRNGHIFFTLL